MGCDHKHEYCLKCLKDSMEDFARNRESPICHRQLCDYQLSRHDISLIPLQRHISDRLLRLAKGEQRPFCSKCQFYVNINENEMFDDHFEQCGDLIPCEFCQMPYSFIQLENHALQCRSEQASFQEKLISFLLLRTKYPFSKEQLRIYLQKEYSNQRDDIDPQHIVRSLAVYGNSTNIFFSLKLIEKFDLLKVQHFRMKFPPENVESVWKHVHMMIFMSLIVMKVIKSVMIVIINVVKQK